MPGPRVDWSELPKELLCLISSRLNSPFYLIRFRSVCASWRSSSPIPDHLQLLRPLPLGLPVASIDMIALITTRTISPLSRCTILLISPPRQHQHQHQHQHHPHPHPWLVKMAHYPLGRTRFLHPFTGYHHKPSHSPHLLDLHDLPVLDLAHGFTVDVHDFAKPVPLWLGPRKDDFALIAIHCSGGLILYRPDDPKGTFHIESPETPYEDVCVHKGAFYAVDTTGRAVTLGPGWSFDVVADPLFAGNRKYLVSCGGELLLLDKHSRKEEYHAGVRLERAMTFYVYRLDEEERRWVEVASFGNRVLFLGDEFSFAADASDLGLDKGGCVVFGEYKFGVPGGELNVFHYDEERVAPLSDYPELSRLFLPPRDWAGFH